MVKICCNTGNSESFARTLLSEIAIKDMFALLEIATEHDLLTSVNGGVISRGCYFRGIR